MSHCSTAQDFQKRYHNVMNELISISQEVEGKINILSELEQNRNSLEKIMHENAQKQKQKIKLDIGGTHFSSSRTTLLRFENTFFWAMLSSGIWQPDDDGYYFIDRNPQYFGIILDYLRTGEFLDPDVEDWPERKKAVLIREFDFYQIPVPEQIYAGSYRWQKEMKGALINLSHQEKVASYNPGDSEGSLWNAVLGSVKNQSFRVKIDYGHSGYVMVGIGTSQLNVHDSTCYSGQHVWLLYTNNGYLYEKGASRSYCDVHKTNGIITIDVLIDPVHKTLSYIIDGEHKGIAFRNLPISKEKYHTDGILSSEESVDLYPCVALFNSGSVELMPCPALANCAASLV